MDIQNFRLMQNYKYKEQELDSILTKQRSMLQQLRKEYESLKLKNRKEKSRAEKLQQKKSLRSIYTFKLPQNKQKQVDETPERTRYGWYQRPLSAFPHKIQELYEQRNRMIQLGNSYSKNNKSCPSVAEAIKRASSAKTPNEMKHEMLNRAKELGNNYSCLFRHKYPPIPHKKYFDDYKKHEYLIKQKNEMGEGFRNTEKLPQNIFSDIQDLEESLNINCKSSEMICLKNGEQLIDELRRPSFMDANVYHDKIKMNQVFETVEIGKIVDAINIVDQNNRKAFENDELRLLNDACNQICSNSISISSECHKSKELNLDELEFYNIRQQAEEAPAFALNSNIYEICEKYIDDMSISNVPKHHPSFEDLSTIQNSTLETKPNIEEIDEHQEFSQASHEICKSQLISNGTESSETTSITQSYEKLYPYSAEDQRTNKSNENPIKRVSWSDINSSSTQIKKHDSNYVRVNEGKFYYKLLLHV